MAKKRFVIWFSSDKDNLKEEDVSIDVYYQEKYNEMRRHRDYQLNTAKWCTVILLAIVAGFVSLNGDKNQTISFCGLCGDVFLKILVVIFIWVIVLSSSKIVDHSAKRYSHLRQWVSENIEPSINDKKYVPENVDIRIQSVIITILVILGFLTTAIVIILK